MKTVVLCIGNRDGGDDTVGSYIAEKLLKNQLQNMVVIDGGIAPENFTGVIKQHKPDILLIIDAIEMSLPSGEIRKVPPEKIGMMHISTHGIPLSVLIKYLQQYVKHIDLIGIQPQYMQGKMSEKVRKSAGMVVNFIVTNKVDEILILP